MKPRTTFRPRKKISAPAGLPAVTDWIEQNVAVTILSDRCRPEHETVRAFRNKIQVNVRYAIVTGELREVNGKVMFGEFICWARGKERYAKYIDALPYVVVARVSGSIPSMQGAMRLVATPVSVEECHKALIAADQRISELEAQIERLLPYAMTGMKMRRPKGR